MYVGPLYKTYSPSYRENSDVNFLNHKISLQYPFLQTEI